MEDRLDSIFSMQKGLSEMMNLDRYPKDTEGKVSALCTAIMHEAVELQRTTNWKWWKTPTEFDKAEARGGSIGSIKLFCELFALVDKETSKKVLKEYQDGEKQYFIDLKLIENLRAQDKKLFDHERGAISAMNIINRIMPILKQWFTRTDQKKVDDFIRIIYQYITSRTPLSGKFIIAKG